MSKTNSHKNSYTNKQSQNYRRRDAENPHIGGARQRRGGMAEFVLPPDTLKVLPVSLAPRQDISHDQVGLEPADLEAQPVNVTLDAKHMDKIQEMAERVVREA